MLCILASQPSINEIQVEIFDIASYFTYLYNAVCDWILSIIYDCLFTFLVYVLNSPTVTVIILNIGTDRSEQTVQTQIRLLLMEQSDQGLLCLLFCLHLLNAVLHCKIQLFQL